LLTPVPIPGDFNHNGLVDAADYVVWRKGLGTIYTQSDYGIWRAHFGQTASGSGATAGLPSRAVPEPAPIALLATALLGVALGRCPNAHAKAVPLT
jgi:hypothetical protein